MILEENIVVYSVVSYTKSRKMFLFGVKEKQFDKDFTLDNSFVSVVKLNTPINF